VRKKKKKEKVFSNPKEGERGDRQKKGWMWPDKLSRFLKGEDLFLSKGGELNSMREKSGASLPGC